MKLITLFFCLLFSAQSMSCLQSAYGKEYDALIKITRTEKVGRYQVTVPTSVGVLTSRPMVTLHYSGGGFKSTWKDVNSQRHIINMTNNDKESIGWFLINKESGDKQTINVYWPPIFGGGCGVMAKTDVQGSD